MGYSFRNLKSREKPDVSVCVLIDGDWKRVGIEVECYYSDRSGEPKRSRRMLGYDVKFAIGRLQAERPEISHIGGCVSTKNCNCQLGPNFPEALAHEIVDIASANPVKPGEEGTIDKFDGFPNLRRIAKRVDLNGLDRPAIWCDWTIFNAWWADIRKGELSDIVCRKNLKAEKYDWDDVAERWLLIAGDAQTGPDLEYRLDTLDLSAACETTPFNRIWLWDRSDNLCKPIHPSGKSIRSPEWHKKWDPILGTTGNTGTRS